MDSLVKPVEKVVEAAEWFVRTPELRVMHIVTSGLLRKVVLKHLTATEVLDCNSAPFFVLESPTEPGDDGWALRCEELRADWEALRQNATPPAEVAPLWPEVQGQSPLTRFGLELGIATSLLRPPITGVIIVLAPVWIRDPPRWRSDLAVLLQVRKLARVRFVVVDVDAPHSATVIEKGADRFETVDATIDEDSLKRETAATLDNLRKAPAGALGYQLVGAAGPAVAPPRRMTQVSLTVAQREEVAREAAISPVLLDPDAMRELRVLVFSAAAAMREGDAIGAVRLQRDARDFCLRHQLVREGVVNELVLASYVLQAGSPDRALTIFREARERAEGAQLPDMAVQAQMALGACLLIQKRTSEAAAAYAEAGNLGTDGRAPIMAVEAFRMCGQLLVAMGHLQQATTAFRRAIEVAEAGGDQVKQSSTVVEAARALAGLCRKHGLVQQADSLEAQAAAIEEASPSPPPSGSPS